MQDPFFIAALMSNQAITGRADGDEPQDPLADEARRRRQTDASSTVNVAPNSGGCQKAEEGTAGSAAGCER
ncbi:hypothetical protein ACFYUH_22230 [Streptomyces fimicarius]|uniref:hypothetical protein n=1 Tax=Streptomyces griseus TaxID=1911 RepID=UPI0036BD9FF6